LDDLTRIVTQSLGPIVVVLGLVALVLAVLVIVLLRRVAALDRRVSLITSGGDGKSLEDTLEAHIDKVYSVAREVDELDGRTTALEKASLGAFSRVGLVRYNPFEDTGGNQSFALAMLDAYGDGYIISSLHTRTVTRVYGKAIAAGRSEAALSEEEAEALRIALASREPGTAKG
jgi:hypothetical protein